MPWDESALYSGLGLTDHVRRNLRRLRTEAGWSQKRLGEAMAGHGWRQWTVADAERGVRSIDVDELFALAALFGVPVAELLIPHPDSINTAEPDPVAVVGIDALAKLLVGEGGKVGKGGADWQAARQVADVVEDDNDLRPAVDLWRARKAEGARKGGKG